MIRTGSEPYLGVLLEYDPEDEKARRSVVELRSPVKTDKPGVGVLGAGNFARMVLLPRISGSTDVVPRILCSAGGVSAAHAGQKNGFERVTSDESAVFDAQDVQAVFSITQHDLHARHVLRAIGQGKHIFVEKPLCLTIEELAEIESARAGRGGDVPIVMVGFNRRFDPNFQALQSRIAQCEIGDVELVTIISRDPAPPPVSYIARSGGLFRDMMIHDFDMARWLLGEDAALLAGGGGGGVETGGGVRCAGVRGAEWRSPAARRSVRRWWRCGSRCRRSVLHPHQPEGRGGGPSGTVCV